MELLDHFFRSLEENEDKMTSAPLWVWLLLIAIAYTSFWFQATITEERFVPSLEFISKTYNIPNDVAGATLVAAGASSPELFSSIVALFITHSSLGLGTVVGSEIFNQLAICAGSILCAQDYQLKLNKAIAIREMGFYAIGIFVLMLAMDDRRVAEDGEVYIYINFPRALMVFSPYVLYVFVLAKFNTWFPPEEPQTKTETKEKGYGSMEADEEKLLLEKAENDDHEHSPIDAYPTNANCFEFVNHYFLYPWKFLLKTTVPDCRKKETSTGIAWLTVSICLVWLIIGSYAMVRSLELLAGLLRIPNLIVGVTVSAAGTSLPNYVASQVAARKGFGDMAVSNAFGSNTFNIMIGLGLPWTIYTAFVEDPYHGLRDDGVEFSIITMASILLAHFLLLMLSNFDMHLWHAVAFMLIYTAYVLYEIIQVYV